MNRQKQMSDFNIPELGSRRARGGCASPMGLMLALAALLLCVIGGFLIWRFLPTAPRSLDPEVVIQEPTFGARIWLNQPNGVFAVARDSKRIAQVELFVDGERAAMLVSTVPTGMNPFPATFEWNPKDEGTHTIFVRALSTDRRTGQSNVVSVNAIPRPAQDIPPTRPEPPTQPGQPGQPGQPAQPEPASPPQPPLPGQPDQPPVPGQPAIWDGPFEPPPGGGPPPGGNEPPPGGNQPPPGGNQPPPGGDQPPPGGNQPPPGGNQPPVSNPSDLSAEIVNDCRITLRWTDNSTDEAGFHIYRLSPGSAIFELAGVVGANVTEFNSEGPHAGQYQFYVVKITASESDAGRSNTIVANIVVGCMPVQGNEELTVEAIEFRTFERYDRIYCYAFVGTVPYTRVPGSENEFITFSGGEYNIREHFAGQNARVISWPSDMSLPLGVECWGWRGDTVGLLGRFEARRSPLDWDGRTWTGGSGPGGSGGGFSLDYRILRRRELPAGGAGVVYTDARIPPPTNLSGMDGGADDLATCLRHVFAGNIDISQNERELCTRNWALMWDWEGNDYVSDRPGAQNQLDGFRVYVRRWIPGQAGSEIEWVATEVRGGRRRGALTPYRVCGMVSEYRVTAFFGDHESPNSSESIQTRGPECKAYVRVQFSGLAFRGPGSVDVYGKINVNDQYRTWGCETIYWGEPAGNVGEDCWSYRVERGHTYPFDSGLWVNPEFTVGLDEGETLTIGFTVWVDESGIDWPSPYTRTRVLDARSVQDWLALGRTQVSIGERDDLFAAGVIVQGLGAPPAPESGAGGGGVRTDLEIGTPYQGSDGTMRVEILNKGPQFLLNETIRFFYSEETLSDDPSFVFQTSGSQEETLTIPVGGKAVVEFVDYIPAPGPSVRFAAHFEPRSFIDMRSDNNRVEREFQRR